MLIIENGYIIDPSQEIEGTGDIAIDNGKIKEVNIKMEGARKQESAIKNLNNDKKIKKIDAKGLYVFPGLFDMHVHLREPGYEHKETIRTGTLAAIKGGFTSVCCMPNTNPINDNETVTEFIARKARHEGVCNVFPIGAITKGQKGEELAEMGMMRDAGCVGFSDDGSPVMNSMIMRRALEYSKVFATTIISHDEDSNLSGDGVMNEGYLSTILGLKGIPKESEVIMIKRDIELASLTGGKLHIAHVSTDGGVNAIREAKKTGLSITAETCPHYFCLTEDEVKGYNTNARVNPPLRTKRDVEAIKEGLYDGTLDVIATDHAPHHRDEKLCEFNRAAPGISGLETALSLSLRLVKEKVLILTQLIKKMTVVPATILGTDKGTLKKGSDADILIVDINKEFKVESSKFESMGENTPFDGWLLKGKPVFTIYKGKVYELSNKK